MNDETNALIRELAEKLGTTGEHLWGVLVTQAPISGVTNILVLVAWVFAVAWSLRLVRSKTSTPKPSEAERFPRAEWVEEGAFAAWAVWGLMALFVAIIGGSELSGIIASIVNPEYWALKQVVP